MTSIQTGNAYPLRVLGVVAAATQEDEQQLHEKFSDIQMSGEWFEGHPRLREFIQSRSVGYLWGTTSDKVKRLFERPRTPTTPNHKGGRPRKYASRADQQAAYRERKAASRPQPTAA
jgi:hypothetical protein